jgi:tryptophan-rich sensory protein
VSRAVRLFLGLFGFVAACLAVELLSGYLTSLSVRTWYAELAKPSWTPPPAAFGPVWTTLYLSMAVAAWLVWKEEGASGRNVALAAFWVQLGLNAGWSGVFFGLRSPELAFAEILLLWAAVVIAIVAFARISRLAAWLLAPYLIWVGYAAALNLAICRLNA